MFSNYAKPNSNPNGDPEIVLSESMLEYYKKFYEDRIKAGSMPVHSDIKNKWYHTSDPDAFELFLSKFTPAERAIVCSTILMKNENKKSKMKRACKRFCTQEDHYKRVPSNTFENLQL